MLPSILGTIGCSSHPGGPASHEGEVAPGGQEEQGGQGTHLVGEVAEMLEVVGEKLE